MPRFNTTGGSGAGGVAGTAGVLGAIPGINIMAPGMAAQAAAEREESIRNQQLGNAGKITGPEYGSDRGVQVSYSGDFTPEMYGDPTMANATMIDDSPEGRAAQLAALADMQGMANQAADSTYALSRNNAEMDARQLAQSREGAIRQDAMRRGKLGGATDMISRQQAAQAAANQNLSGGMQSAQLQALQQLAGMQAAGGLAGQLRGQDLQRNTGNAGIANQFELYNTGNMNDTSRANTNLGNSAQLRNLNATQDINNQKTGLGMQKLDRNDRNANSGFDAQMSQYNAVNNALEGQATAGRTALSTGQQAGQIGSQNFKDLMKMVGGG
jgi:hypothetical protein